MGEVTTHDLKLRRTTLRLNWFVAAAMMIGIASLTRGPAVAQTPELEACFGRGSTTLDQRIAGCTAVIRSGRLTGKPLSFAYNARGLAFASSGQMDPAIDDFDEAIRNDPENAEAFSNRSLAQLKNKQYDQAVGDFGRSIAIAPDAAAPWAFLGDTLYEMGQPDRAIQSFEEAIKRAPDWMWAYNDRGELYLDRGDYDLAIKDFDQTVRTSTDMAMGWTNRCRAYLIVGRLDEALRDCNEALKLEPNFVNRMLKSGQVSAIEHRGLVHLKAGRWDLAIADLDDALVLTPESAEVLYSRGIVKSKLGDQAAGNADMARASKIQGDIADRLAAFGIK
jgi:tetratricopeptide (TPR) repeat protein